MHFLKKNHKQGKNIRNAVSNKIVIVVVLVLSTLLSFKALDKETYTAVVEDSMVEWAGSRPGKTHNGTVEISSGTFDYEEGKLVGGDFILDMTSVKVLDIKPGKSNDKLVNHFKSTDFFDVNQHPTGTFKISGSEIKNSKTLVKGMLTIKGITNEISFLADIKKDDTLVVLNSEEFKIDRTKWDIKFRSSQFFDNLKNKLIYDDITLSLKVQAKK